MDCLRKMSRTSDGGSPLVRAFWINLFLYVHSFQEQSVEEHFKALMSSEELIDSEPSTVTPNDLPHWYNGNLFKEAQELYSSNMLSMGAGGLMGLIAVLSLKSTLEVLIFTKQSSIPCTAFRRYAQTMLHIYTLYYADVKNPYSKWYKSINTIRWKHSTSNRRAQDAKVGSVSQKDMVLTQFGFIGYILLEPLDLGLPKERENREALSHFWRVVGHMLGISDRLNICRKNETETTALCQLIRDKVIAENFRKRPPNFLDMANVMLDGFWCIDFTLDNDAILAKTYKMTGVEYFKPLGWYSWFNSLYHEFIFQVLRIRYIGSIVRIYFNNFLKINYWVLERWPIVARLRFGSNTRIILHPKMK